MRSKITYGPSRLIADTVNQGKHRIFRKSAWDFGVHLAFQLEADIQISCPAANPELRDIWTVQFRGAGCCLSVC